MKNLFKPLFAIILTAITFTACMDKSDIDNTDYLEQIAKERRRVDSTLTAQKPILKAYAEEHFTNPMFDDSTGIWFEVLKPATDETYEYKVNSSGSWITPVATIRYKGQLLNGTVFDAPTQPVEFQIVESSQYNPSGLILSWPIAFRPRKITFGGKEYHTGLTEKGLKKGSQIRFVAPSPYCYDNRATADGKIPKDSPLDFTIEVVEIK